MNRALTDNSYFADKVYLRLRHLPNKQTIKVLELYAGSGKIWRAVQKLTDKNIQICNIDKKQQNGIYLIGDNIKFLKAIEFKNYDIICLDAYGVPYQQLKIILDRYRKSPFNCRLFITFIQSVYGRLPLGMLEDLGYTRRMVKKISTLFDRNGFVKFKNWLSLYGIQEITHRSSDKKHYVYIELKEKEIICQ